ncbi:hypothetical protein GGD81_003662 [Rhodobium orientis]|uniref:DUF454 domain-containing protein n=1 Tax=Rhodobium orientis TaxID=34017 RepID=A0A327JM51_9HYPH|nr:YbaN family protein [Rhodobium orientis]MBB4304602.1 hypothetical protein [Rhodobium orientis]MBK5951364.1 hypothetical protein [Rhodobium orientis]RAI27560.1 hypothetical protein CH339_10005 [Rhodobium orientis]
MRLIWMALGFLSLALGALGAVLPLLPTTPFLLLAAFSFARSSERFHDWLINHRYFGPPIRDWRESGAISQRAKILGTAAMAGAVALSAVIGVPPMLLAVQAAVMIPVCLFIWTRPSPQRVPVGVAAE